MVKNPHMGVSMHVCLHAWNLARVSGMYVFLSLCVSAYVCMYMSVCAHVYVCVYVCRFMFLYKCFKP